MWLTSSRKSWRNLSNATLRYKSMKICYVLSLTVIHLRTYVAQQVIGRKGETGAFISLINARFCNRNLYITFISVN